MQRRLQVQRALNAARQNKICEDVQTFAAVIYLTAEIDPIIFAENCALRHTCIDRMKQIIFVEKNYYHEVKSAMTELRITLQRSFDHENFVKGPYDEIDIQNLWAGQNMESYDYYYYD